MCIAGWTKNNQMMKKKEKMKIKLIYKSMQLTSANPTTTQRELRSFEEN